MIPLFYNTNCITITPLTKASISKGNGGGGNWGGGVVTLKPLKSKKKEIKK
jgi:hypothetical protein